MRIVVDTNVLITACATSEIIDEYEEYLPD